MAKTNPFAQFVTTEKKKYIKALDAEITYRELTMAENDKFTKKLIKGYSKDGGAEFDMAEATEVGYEKVALCLIDPKMTVAELKALPASASSAINEIIKAIEGSQDEMVDDEGNSED